MKVEFEQIGIEVLRKYIEIGFEHDPELIRDIHISPGTLEHCVNHNFESVKAAADSNGIFYKVVYGKSEIGFVVAVQSPNLVVSFGINIAYRVTEVLISFIEQLKELYQDERFAVVVWSKNKRAINFFARNNFNIYLGDNKMVYLWQ